MSISYFEQSESNNKTRRGKIFNFRTEEPRNIWIEMPFIQQNRHKG